MQGHIGINTHHHFLYIRKNSIDGINCHTIVYHFRLYETEYKPSQHGVCGITCNVNWPEPRDPNNVDDNDASETNLQFNLGWFLHPIAVDGNYPRIMREKIDTKSEVQGM